MTPQDIDAVNALIEGLATFKGGVLMVRRGWRDSGRLQDLFQAYSDTKWDMTSMRHYAMISSALMVC